MRIEKWIYKGKEVEVPILDDEEIEINEDNPELEITKDLSKELKNVGGLHDK